MDENQCATPAGGEIEGLAIPQQNVRSCTRSNDELVMEMQCTYDEQQSNMGDMFRQVALLTEMMKKIQGNIARSEVNESREKEEVVKEDEEKEPANAERKSEALREETETVEIESDGKEILTEEESITTPPDDEALEEILEEESDEPQEKGEEVIKRYVELNDTLFYLKSEEVHMPNEKVDEFTIAVKGENTPAERPPPVIDKSEGCCYEEEEPELQEERWRRKAARSIYSGLRPKENKKVQGTYRNHKKKRGATIVMNPQKNQWIGRRRVNSGALVDDQSHNGSPIFELIKLERKSKPLDQVNCIGGNWNQRMDDYEKGMKLLTQRQ